MTTTQTSYGFMVAKSLPRHTALYTVLKHASTSGLNRWYNVYYIDANGKLKDLPITESKYWATTRHHGAFYKIKGNGVAMDLLLVKSFGELLHNDPEHFLRVTL